MLERSGPLGHWRIIAEDDDVLESAAGIAAVSEQRATTHSDLVICAGRQARLACRVFRGRARFRAAWQQLLPWGATPSMREYENLIWLRDRLFQAPKPIASGVRTKAGMPCSDFLLTDVNPSAMTLESLFRENSTREGSRATSATERTQILRELAREVARMHALRFIHGNLVPSSITVGPPSQSSRVHLSTDARGGPCASTEAWLRELARFAVRAEASLTNTESRQLVETYVEERRAQGRPVDAARLDAELQAFRRSLA